MSDNAKGNASSYRLPLVKSAADVARLAHLDAAGKALALENLNKVPMSDGYALLGNDPQAQALVSMFENALQHLLTPDMQFVPGSPMNLMTLKTASRYRSEWMLSIVSIIVERSVGTMQIKDFRPAYLALLNEPDAKVWTSEQRLALKFANACLDRAMTDEIFAEAKKTWGEQRTIRLIIWGSFVQMWTMLIDAFGLTYLPGSMPAIERGADPKIIDAVLKPKIAKTWDGLMSAWSGLTVPKH